MKVKSISFLSLCLLLLVCWSVVYANELVAMEAIWRRSDTFAHGYFIVPIVVWLLWQDRKYLLTCQVSSSWLPLPFLVVSLIVGLFAVVADINGLAQLSAVFTLIFLIWGLVGHKIAWRCKFPLVYLLFAVPMGESLIPFLQDITAWFSVLFLQLSNIPVYQDGLYLQTSTGMFEVAVACSGIRYLIASLAIGCLYAHLTYRSYKKQWLFILLSLVVPILANGLRAYGIIVIAHLSDMEYATGVDHLIYGWMFFVIIILLMFYIGNKFSDGDFRDTVDSASDISELKQQNSKLVFSALPLFFLVVLTGGSGFLKRGFEPVIINEQPVAAIKHKELLPISQSDWGIDYPNSLALSHVKNPQNTEVYHAVYAQLQNKGELISQANVLFNASVWTAVKQQKINLQGHEANFILLKSFSGETRTIIYWYKVVDDIYTSSVQVKAQQAKALLFQPKSTSMILAFSKKNVQLEEFVSEVDAFKTWLNANAEK